MPKLNRAAWLSVPSFRPPTGALRVDTILDDDDVSTVNESHDLVDGGRHAEGVLNEDHPRPLREPCLDGLDRGSRVSASVST
jgi:hypothetical protein